MAGSIYGSQEFSAQIQRKSSLSWGLFARFGKSGVSFFNGLSIFWACRAFPKTTGVLFRLGMCKIQEHILERLPQRIPRFFHPSIASTICTSTVQSMGCATSQKLCLGFRSDPNRGSPKLLSQVWTPPELGWWSHPCGTWDDAWTSIQSCEERRPIRKDR